MSMIPETTGGLTETEAIEAGTMLREGWNTLRSLQFNKTASILRYTVTDSSIEQDRKAYLGMEPTKELTAGLADLPVYVSQLSIREVEASRGKLELTDLLFVLWSEVKSTDQILYAGTTYEIVQIRFYDVDIGQCGAIGRAV